MILKDNDIPKSSLVLFGLDKNFELLVNLYGTSNKKTEAPKKPKTPEPEEEEVVRVEKFTYNGTTYLLDKNSGDLYDQETQDIVGRKTSEGVELD